MTISVAAWDSKVESYQEYSARKRREAQDEAIRRRVEALFKLSLARLDWTRYAFGVEHGMEKLDGPCRVHAYVVCKDCYRDKVGQVDPRTSVATSAITAVLPDNEVLRVGTEMLEAVQAMIGHEQIHHQAQSRARV